MPGDLVLEGSGEPRPRTRPGNGRHEHAMLATAHPWRRRGQPHLDRAQVQSPPAPLRLAGTVPPVIQRRDPIALAAPPLGRLTRAHPGDDPTRPGIPLDAFDDRPLIDTQHVHPYART